MHQELAMAGWPTPQYFKYTELLLPSLIPMTPVPSVQELKLEVAWE